MSEEKIIIIGAGPAGLTSAYKLAERGREPTVLESRGQVGGIACTENYKGFHFDMGGHRFFSQHSEPYSVWNAVLDEDFLVRGRLSRIYYKGKFFDYPLRTMNALKGIGPIGVWWVLQSYVWRRFFPLPQEDNFEQWVTNRFGRRLFLTFFKSYTEKVWGIPCTELSAQWAAQRIRDLSLKKAIAGMFTASRKEIRTLIDRFHYPKKGPGMLWEAVKAAVERNGGEVLLHQKARRIFREGRRITGVVADGEAGVNLYPVSQLISSMPITDFVLRLEPRPPLQILDAARKLKYRAFLTVCLIIDQPDLFPDQWVYVHDPNVKMGRIQNYKNWSPYMVPDPTKTGLGLEYFCNKGDEIWNMPDEELIELGKEELSRMGLVDREAVEDGTVFRVPKAYPVYCDGYDDHLRSLRGFLEGLENFQSVGRNGLFRYNNMDHSMLTAFIAADHVCGKKEQDVWSVNEEQQYLEEAKKEEEGAEPDEAGLWAELEVAFRKIDKTALGVAFGAVCGLGLLLMTWVLVLKGGEVVGPTLGLLRQYFPGYSVTWPGGLVGFLYAFAVGFLTGWFGAAIRNLIVVLLLILARWKVRKAHLNRLLDYI